MLPCFGLGRATNRASRHAHDQGAIVPAKRPNAARVRTRDVMGWELGTWKPTIIDGCMAAWIAIYFLAGRSFLGCPFETREREREVFARSRMTVALLYYALMLLLHVLLQRLHPSSILAAASRNIR